MDVTTPNSRLAYKTHFDLMDLAMADPKGIRVRQPDYGTAWRLRLELHHSRSIDRKDNALTYEKGHVLHGCSIYDQLLITIEQGDEVWLYLHKRDVANFQVESLSGLPEAMSVEEEAEHDFTTPAQVLEQASERRF